MCIPTSSCLGHRRPPAPEFLPASPKPNYYLVSALLSASDAPALEPYGDHADAPRSLVVDVTMSGGEADQTHLRVFVQWSASPCGSALVKTPEQPGGPVPFFAA